MVHACWKPLLWMSLIIMGASILMRDVGAVSFRGRELGTNCACNSSCGIPCPNPSPPPPHPPVLLPPPPPPAGPLPPFCPPPPNQPYTPAPPYWPGPPATLYPLDLGYRSEGAGRSSMGWLPVLVGCGLLALWL